MLADWLIPLLVSVLAVSSLKLAELLIANSATFRNKRTAAVTDRLIDSYRERLVEANIELDAERTKAENLGEQLQEIRVNHAVLETTNERLQSKIEQLEWRIKDLEEQSGPHGLDEIDRG